MVLKFKTLSKLTFYSISLCERLRDGNMRAGRRVSRFHEWSRVGQSTSASHFAIRGVSNVKLPCNTFVINDSTQVSLYAYHTYPCEGLGLQHMLEGVQAVDVIEDRRVLPVVHAAHAVQEVRQEIVGLPQHSIAFEIDGQACAEEQRR